MCQRQVSFVWARSGGHYKSVSDSSNGERGLYLNPKERNSLDSCVDMCASSFHTKKLKLLLAGKLPKIEQYDFMQIILGHGFCNPLVLQVLINFKLFS